jgi:tryptophan-rich sensory protein
MWNPPAWLFAPTWTLLYLLMGAAVWRAWRVGGPAPRRIVAVYFLQLVVNAAWSVLFFGLRRPAWALADIFALWALLVWIQARLAGTDRLAAWLWCPYLLWVSFAGVLNLAIVLLN